MALVPGYNPQNLQDVINQSAGSQAADLTNQYTQARRQTIADQGSSGRLLSGVSDYPLTDLQTNYQQGLSGIQQNAAQEEAGIPSEDWLNSQQFGRQLSLANDIASRLKPDMLSQIFSGVGAAGSLGGLAAGLGAL